MRIQKILQMMVAERQSRESAHLQAEEICHVARAHVPRTRKRSWKIYVLVHLPSLPHPIVGHFEWTYLQHQDGRLLLTRRNS